MKKSQLVLTYNVPTGTPLVLGSDFIIKDNEQSTLLFNWDQMDRQMGTNPNKYINCWSNVCF